MKHFVLAIAGPILLSACASSASIPSLGGSPAMLVTPVGLSRTDATAHEVYPVRSVYEVVYAKGYKAVAYTLNGRCALTRGPGGIVTGCTISGGSSSPYYTKSSFYLHTEPNGNGCTLAVAHFHGQTYSGQVIRMTFYWVTNPCYR